MRYFDALDGRFHVSCHTSKWREVERTFDFELFISVEVMIVVSWNPILLYLLKTESKWPSAMVKFITKGRIEWEEMDGRSNINV